MPYDEICLDFKAFPGYYLLFKYSFWTALFICRFSSCILLWWHIASPCYGKTMFNILCCVLLSWKWKKRLSACFQTNGKAWMSYLEPELVHRWPWLHSKIALLSARPHAQSKGSGVANDRFLSTHLTAFIQLVWKSQFKLTHLFCCEFDPQLRRNLTVPFHNLLPFPALK